MADHVTREALLRYLVVFALGVGGTSALPGVRAADPPDPPVQECVVSAQWRRGVDDRLDRLAEALARLEGKLSQANGDEQ